MQLYVFLIITVLLIVKPTVNALFLNRLGADNLAFGFIFIAATAIISSYFYSRAVKFFSLKRIIISTLIFFSTSFILLGALLLMGWLGSWLLYVFYVVAGIFAVLTASQFWLLANMVFNAREAKRLFGFIGAGGIAGGIFGGYLTNILAPLIGNAYLLVVAAFLILCCIPILLKIYAEGKVSRSQRLSGSEGVLDEPAFRLLIKSKHLTFLALIIGLGVIVAKLVDFQFSDFASRAIPDSDNLASFFGFWFSTFNLISLFIQLFLTNRVVEKIGVNSSLLILPLGIALGSLLFLTYPELWVLVIIKGIDGSLKQSVNKAATELAMVPVPLAIKNRTKSFIDVVVDSVATGFAGCLLIFVIKGLNLPSTYVTVIILLLIFVWLVGIFKVRDSYFKSFRESLQAAIENAEGVPLKRKKSSLQVGRMILNHGKPEEIVKYVHNLTSVHAKSLRNEVLTLLKHPSNEVKVAAISQLYKYPKSAALDEVRRLVHVKDDDVVYAAMNYLIVHTDLSDDRIFDSYLNHSSDYIAHAALLCLAKEAAHDPIMASRYNLELRIELWLAELELPDSEHRVEEMAFLLNTIGFASLPQFYSFISANFNNRDNEIVMHAIEAAGITKDPMFIDALIDFLTVKTYRAQAIDALKSYGESISSELLQREAEKQLKGNVKKYIPRVIEKFKTQPSVRVLIKLLNSKDIQIRHAAAKSLNKVKGKAPKLNYFPKAIYRIILQYCNEYREVLQMREVIQHDFVSSKYDGLPQDDLTELNLAREALLDVLNEQLSQRLETIFLLLGVYYSRKDMSIAYGGINSPVHDTRQNAIEFLDNILSPQLRSSLLSIIETDIVEEHHRADNELLNPSSVSFNDALLYLLSEGDARMRLPVIYLIQYLGDEVFLAPLRNLKATAKNKDVITFTDHALKKLKPLLVNRVT
tara:strand:+ start:159 stop:2930 length:2772 start_codon:yes stop_codon:yes gene_type:complete